MNKVFPKISYSNMTVGDSRLKFTARYYLCSIRTWLQFTFRWPWVKYSGFARVMKGCGFARFDISLGQNVQFGEYCNVSAPVKFGNNVLCAGHVCFVSRHDHTFSEPGVTIWNGSRDVGGSTVVGDDVWIGHRATIVGPVTIGSGSVVAAGAVVTKDIGPCEIWGGVPARKIGDRFASEEDKVKHLKYLVQCNVGTL